VSERADPRPAAERAAEHGLTVIKPATAEGQGVALVPVAAKAEDTGPPEAA
jgi:hypothetical protein